MQKINIFSLSLTVIMMILFILGSTNIYGASIKEDNEFQNALQWGNSQNLTKYDNINNFRPTDLLTRQEAAKFFVNYSENTLDIQEQENTNCNFSDTENADPTLKPYIQKACKLGIIKGHKNKFMPFQSLTKPQAITILVRAQKGQMDETTNPWYLKYYEYARNQGITNQTLNQISHNASRYEVMLMLFRSKGGEISKQSSFEVSFAQDMDKGSVEKNLKVYPSIEKEITWETPKTMKISFKDTAEKSQKYLLNISENAQTATGKKISNSIVKEFKTDGLAKINFVSPMGEITDLNKNITVRFSKPMVPLTTLDSQKECPINITPDISGKCVWITTNSFQFRPESGFPIGGDYNINIPSGISTIYGDKTVNSKNFGISTPKLELKSAPEKVNKDQELLIGFNGDINIQEFNNNFSIQGINKNNLNIKHYETTKQGTEITETKENIISIYPKNGDWGYGNTYTYTVSENLTTQRGNTPLGEKVTKKLQIQDLVTSYNPFVYKSMTGDKNTQNNLKFSSNENIITKENPNILLTFHEEVDLDKSLFQLNKQFDISYLKEEDCTSGECKLINNKKKIILNINGSIENSFSVTVKSSQISSSEDKTITFQTKDYNKIEDFKFVDYKNSCITFSNDIGDYGYNQNIESFDFGGDGKLVYMQKVDKYRSENDKCNYTPGKHTYRMHTRLTPDKDINLNIKKSLLDKDNYQLDQNYNYNFHTNPAMNEDKHISLHQNRDLNLVPTNIDPITLGVKTTNLDKINVEVCQGGFDITNVDYISDYNCNQKTLDVENLGFNENFFVVNLNQVFGTGFTKPLVNAKVSKLEEDKADYEKGDEERTYNKVSFFRTDKSLAYKPANPKGLLWLSDFRSGETLTDKIESIKNYKEESVYNMFGHYKGRESKFVNSLDFQAEENGKYLINGEVDDKILVELKSGEEIFLDTRGANTRNYDESATFVTTERSLYKPGDKVYVKGIVRKAMYDGLEIDQGSITFAVRSPEGDIIKEKNISLSQRGSFDETINLDSDAPLGTYSVRAGNEIYTFLVQEYEKPDFKVETSSDKDFYTYDETVEVDVQADYYLGAPLINGEGEYTITAEDFHFNGGKTKGYIWGEHNNYWIYNPYQSTSKKTITSNQQFNLNSQGTANLDIPLESTEEKNIQDKVYTVSTTVQDPNTQKRVSNATSFKVLRSKTFVGMKMDDYYYQFGDTAKLDFVTVDQDGDKIGNQNIVFNLYKTNYENGKQQEEKVYSKELTTNNNGNTDISYKFEDSGEFKFEVKLQDKAYKTTKSIFVSGRSLTRPPEREHKINIMTNKDQYNIGDNAEIVLQTPATGGKALVTVEKLDGILKTDIVDINSTSQKYNLNIKKEYLPNVHLKVFYVKDVASSQNALNQLKTIRSEMMDIEEKILEEYDTDIPRPIIYEVSAQGITPPIPAKEEDIPKDLLQKLADLRIQEQKLIQDILPNWYVGEKNIKLSLDSVSLDTQVSTNKENYLPGESSEITLNITDNNGNPINGEATIAVIDKSLLALKDKTTNLINFFYKERPSYIDMMYNMERIIKRINFQGINENIGVDGRGGGVGGGGQEFYEAEDTATMQKSMADAGAPSSTQQQDINIRENFKDTAYYKGTLEVNNGKATIDISQLPDNLTTWVVRGFVHTQNSKVGNFENEFKTQKKLSLIPSMPNFIMAGDKSQISTVVVNNTDQSRQVNLSLEASNIQIEDKNKSTTIGANQQKSVAWDIEVQGLKENINFNTYNTNVTIRAASDDISDGYTKEIPIKPYSTPEYTFTNGSTTGVSYKEQIYVPSSVDKDMGKIDITIGATILTNLVDSIQNIANMPGDNFYHTLSALNKGATLKSLYTSIGRENVFNNIQLTGYDGKSYYLKNLIPQRIKDFEKYQQTDGGFAYYQDCKSRFYQGNSCSSFSLTKNFLLVADNLQENGYNINNSMLSKAISYYKTKLKDTINEYEQNGNVYKDFESFYALAVHGETNFINNYLKESYENLSNMQKLQYIQLLQEMNIRQSQINSIISSLENSIIMEARGSLLPANGGNNIYGDNNISSTALALKVFINSGETEKYIVENFARWLMAQKDSQGLFGSNYTSSKVIRAITKYVNYTNELENVSFSAQGYINGQEKIFGEFEEENKFSSMSKSLPLDETIKFDQNNSLGFKKQGSGKLYYDVGLKYFLPVEDIAPRDEGIIVERNYYDFQDYMDAFEEKCYTIRPFYGVARGGLSMPRYGGNNCYWKQVKSIQPVKQGQKGELLVGQLEVTVPHQRNNVLVNNYIPAGAQIANTNFDITSSQVKDITGQSGNYGGFSNIQSKTDRVRLFANKLYQGNYKYTYVIKLNHKGEYHHRPARASLLEKPEIWGRTSGEMFEVK